MMGPKFHGLWRLHIVATKSQCAANLINTSSQLVATRILQRWHSGLDHVNFRTLHQISLYSLIIGFSMNWRLIKEIKSNIMFSACFDYDIDVYYMGAFTVGVLLLGQRI